MAAPAKKTATKAVTVFLTGANTWAALYLPAVIAGAWGVVTATLLVFLVPNIKNEPADPRPWNPPTLGHVGPDPEAGVIDGGGLVLALVCFLLGVLACHARIFGL